MKRWLLGMLAFLVVAHLSILTAGALECRRRAQPGEICTSLSERVQIAVDGYIAVILALMAKVDS